MPENDIKFPNEKKLKEKKDVENILTKIGSSVEKWECRCLGRYDTDKSRPILVTFKNVWDKRICFPQALKSKLYNSDNILVLLELSPEDKIIGKKLLAKRYDLIKNKNDVEEKHLKIRRLKLYNDNQLVSVDWLFTLKLGLLNSRSIASFSQRLSLINFAHSQKIDLLCLTETWSDSSLKDNFFISSNYIVGSRTDRKNGSQGVTSIIRRNGISLNAISVKTGFCCSAVLNLGFPLLIVNSYNPPNNSPYRVNPLDIKLFLESLLRRFEGKKTLIMGDFNQLDFEAESYHTGDVSFCSLIDFVLEQNFHQIVDRPNHNGNHMLELIWSDFSEVLLEDYNLIEVSFSDHSCVTINVPCKIPKQTRSPIETIPRLLIRTAGAYLSESVFSVFLPKKYSFLNNWLLSFDSHLDVFRRVERNKGIDAPYYYSSHTMHQLNNRNTAYRKCLKSQSNYPFSLDKDCAESIKLDTELFLEQFCQCNSGIHGCFRLLTHWNLTAARSLFICLVKINF